MLRINNILAPLPSLKFDFCRNQDRPMKAKSRFLRITLVEHGSKEAPNDLNS